MSARIKAHSDNSNSISESHDKSLSAGKGKEQHIEQHIKQHNLYKNLLLEEYIYLKPTDLKNNIDEVILGKLKRKVEGTCIRVGYVMPDSLKILSRSLGIINNANFDGITMYKIKFTADVCNPAIGQVVQCEVANIDKSQIICYVDNPDKSPLEIYLFKHHHVGNADFIVLKPGDVVNVRVGGSKWEYHDTKIIAIAQFINKV